MAESEETGVDAKKRGPSRLTLVVAGEDVSSFFRILQRGFYVRAAVESPLRTFLCSGLGLSPEYVAGRITTIFLDGKPVDDLEESRVVHGSHLSLSAAMPGLVGAVLRRGSRYAAFREAITYRQDQGHQGVSEGVVHLKLFNLVMEEVGPTLLTRGVTVNSRELHEFFLSEPDVWTACAKVLLDGAAAGRETLQDGEWPFREEFVELKVVTERHGRVP